MTSALVSLHVTSHTECFAASKMWALEGLLSGVRMAVDSKAARPRESLVASGADVTIL